MRSEAGYADLSRRNVAAQRSTSGHLHLGWNLRTPVHRGDTVRPRPLAALGRIAGEYVGQRSDRTECVRPEFINPQYATVTQTAEYEAYNCTGLDRS